MNRKKIIIIGLLVILIGIVGGFFIKAKLTQQQLETEVNYYSNILHNTLDIYSITSSLPAPATNELLEENIMKLDAIKKDINNLATNKETLAGEMLINEVLEEVDKIIENEKLYFTDQESHDINRTFDSLDKIVENMKKIEVEYKIRKIKIKKPELSNLAIIYYNHISKATVQLNSQLISISETDLDEFNEIEASYLALMKKMDELETNKETKDGQEYFERLRTCTDKIIANERNRFYNYQEYSKEATRKEISNLLDFLLEVVKIIEDKGVQITPSSI